MTITAGLLLLVFGVNRGEIWGWTDSRTLGVLAASLVLHVAFLVIETRVSAAARPPGARHEPDGRPRQRRRLPAPGLVLLADLHRDPLHAAGPRLQRPRGRAGLAHRLGARARGGGDDRGGAGRADRRAPHPGHRALDPDGRALRPVPAGRRLDLRRPAFCPGSSCPASGSGSASPRPRSRPSPASTRATAGSPRAW